MSAPATSAPVAAAAPVAAPAAAAAVPNGNAPRPAQTPSLFVGDLHPDVNENMIYETFSRVSNVQSVKIPRDLHTRRSLGYAYVNFASPQDAEVALETLNHTDIKDRPCRIMWCQRDPALRRTGVGNVFVKNLSAKIDNKVLYDVFSRYGNILSCKVVSDERGGSKGYAYVHFQLPEHADAAIAGKDGQLLDPTQPESEDNRVLVVQAFKRKGERPSNTFTNVYFRNLPQEFTEQQFRELVSKCGDVNSVYFPVDDATGKCQGYGFANYADAKDAKHAIESYHDTEVSGSKLFVTRAKNKRELAEERRAEQSRRQQERVKRFEFLNVFVKNLDEGIDDDKLKAAFAPFGKITSAKVMVDQNTGVSKGFGFVCFDSPEEAQRAITDMNGKMLGSKPIYVALHQTRERRKQYLEIVFAQRAKVPAPYGMPPMFAAPPNMPGAPYYQMRPAGFPPAGPPFAMAPQMRGAPRQPRMVNNAYATQFPRRRAPQPRPQHPQAVAGAPTGQKKIMSDAVNMRTDGHDGMPEANAPYHLAQEGLTQMDTAQRKQYIGERLYPLVHQMQPALAGKITGMLLQMDADTLMRMIDSPSDLGESIQAAVSVLEEAKYQTEA